MLRIRHQACAFPSPLALTGHLPCPCQDHTHCGGKESDEEVAISVFIPSFIHWTFTECQPSTRSCAGASTRSSQPGLVTLRVYAGDRERERCPLTRKTMREHAGKLKEVLPLTASASLTAGEKSSEFASSAVSPWSSYPLPPRSQSKCTEAYFSLWFWGKD